MSNVPFTINADLELGERIAPFLADGVGDVEIYEGVVPESISGEKGGPAYRIQHGKMLLNIPDGTRFLIEDGQRIVYTRGEKATDKDVALFLLGSAWGALCYQRGLIPLHASAVAIDGNIHAFTGLSGAGKSTLAAALAANGLEFFTDDVLIFDPTAHGSGAVCYAGQKDLKLWGDAVELTGSTAFGKVRDGVDIDKHFVRPKNASQLTAGSLINLFVLTQKSDYDEPKNSIEPISGSKALKSVMDSIYRPRYAETLLGRRKLFEGLKQLVETVHVAEFQRVFLKENFEDSVAFLASELSKNAVER